MCCHLQYETYINFECRRPGNEARYKSGTHCIKCSISVLKSCIDKYYNTSKSIYCALNATLVADTREMYTKCGWQIYVCGTDTCTSAVLSLVHLSFLFRQNLNKLAELVRGELPKLIRNIIGALITIDVHARDIVTQMVHNKVTTLYSTKFEVWIGQSVPFYMS